MLPRIQYEHTITGGPSHTPYIKRQNSLTVRYPCVCEPCNNVWMGDIERLVIPVLKPIIQGFHPTGLNKQARHALALWMSLRAIVVDAYCSTQEKPEFFTKAERIAFANSKTSPLSNSHLWVGAMTPGLIAVSAYSSKAAINHSKAIGVQIFSCFIGEAVLQMFISKGDWASLVVNRKRVDIDVEKYSSGWQGLAFQAWPHRPISTWPPQHRFTERGFEIFSDRFGI